MKTFVINLKRRPDRLETFYKNCPIPKESIEVVHGFDGKFPDKENKKEHSLFKNKLKNLGLRLNFPGERGVFISHLRIWKKMVNENISSAMIFEDDAQFNKNFNEFITKLIIPEDFNILFLGGRFTKDFMMTPQTSTRINESIVVHNYKNWEPMYHDRTAHAYIMSYKLAKFFLELFNIITDPPPVDHFMTKYLLYNNIPVYSSVPLICWSPMVGDSDIR